MSDTIQHLGADRPAPRTNLTSNEYLRLQRLLELGEAIDAAEAQDLRRMEQLGRLDRAEREVITAHLQRFDLHRSHEGQLRQLRQRIAETERNAAYLDAVSASEPQYDERVRQEFEAEIQREARRRSEENVAAIRQAEQGMRVLGSPPPPPPQLVALIRQHLAEGLDHDAIAGQLEAAMVRTIGREPKWTAADVASVLARSVPERLEWSDVLSHARAEAERRRPKDPAAELKTLKAELVELEKAGPEATAGGDAGGGEQ